MTKPAFILFVSGSTPRNTAMYRDIQAAVHAICPDMGSVTLIDVLAEPDIGMKYDILVTPTLINVAVMPPQRVVGDITENEQLTAWLSQWSSEDLSQSLQKS